MVSSRRALVVAVAVAGLVGWTVGADRAGGEAQDDPMLKLMATVTALRAQVDRQGTEIDRLQDQVFGDPVGSSGSAASLGSEVVRTSLTGSVFPMPWQIALRCDIAENPEKAQYADSPAYVLLCRQ